MSSRYSRHRGRRRVHDTSIGSWARIDSMPCSTDKLRKSRLTLSQETKDFIVACEALRRRLADQGPFTGPEKDLIEYSALELLNHVKPLD
jgi:hypothetical protein